MKTVLHFLYEGTGDLPKIKASFVQKRIHANVSYSFPQWPEWTHAQAMQLDAICGPVMKELGYGGELAWRKLVVQ